MSELKPCPFCEKPFEIMEVNDGFMYKHESLECPIASWGENGANWMEKQSLIDALNTRPLESAARTEGYKAGEREGAVKVIEKIEQSIADCGDGRDDNVSYIARAVEALRTAYEGSDGNGNL